VSGLDRAFAKADQTSPSTTSSQPKGQPGVADADSVVRQSLAALDRDKSIVITGGIGNRLVAGLSKVTPYETIAKFVEGVFRPKD
jgi:short-subunit dehydrogenase